MFGMNCGFSLFCTSRSERSARGSVSKAKALVELDAGGAAYREVNNFIPFAYTKTRHYGRAMTNLCNGGGGWT